MEITPITLAGAGLLHDCVTRDGQRFRVLIPLSGGIEIFVDDPLKPDVTVASIVLGDDEADHVVELLRSRSTANELTERAW